MEKLTFKKTLEKISQLETTDVYSFHVDNENRTIQLVLNDYNGVYHGYVDYRVYDDEKKVDDFYNLMEEKALEVNENCNQYEKYSFENFTVMLGLLSDLHNEVDEEKHREFAKKVSFNKYTLVKIPSNLYTMELAYQFRELGYKTSTSLTTSGSLLMVAK